MIVTFYMIKWLLAWVEYYIENKLFFLLTIHLKYFILEAVSIPLSWTWGVYVLNLKNEELIRSKWDEYFNY